MENQEVFTYYTGGPPPNWLERHSWYAPVTVAPAETMPLVGLRKLELKVEMCCMKCAEIVSEEIREVPGVLDVQVDYVLKKVVVIGMPFEPDVLKRARKVDKKAHIWIAPPPPPPAPPALEPAPAPLPESAPIVIQCSCTCQCKGEAKKEAPKKEEEKPKDASKKEGEKNPEEEKKPEEKPKDEEKKDEPAKKVEDKKDKEQEKAKDEPEKPKDEAPAAPALAPTPQLAQFPPFEYMVSRYPMYDYHPSQSYNPLLPYNPNPYSPQVFYDWHFRTTEGPQAAAFVPAPKAAPYPSVGDLWNIFLPP